VLALALAAIGAWFGDESADRLAHEVRLLTPGLVAATMLSPALLLPMLGTGSDLARRGQSAAAVSSHVLVTLLNLCLLLPLVVQLQPVATSWPLDLSSPTGILRQLRDRAQFLPYPMATWRVDTVILAMIGFLLIPYAMGKWRLGRAEGIGLVVGYCFYLMLVTAAGVVHS
jgi:hypothetical protein